MNEYVATWKWDKIPEWAKHYMLQKGMVIPDRGSLTDTIALLNRYGEEFDFLVTTAKLENAGLVEVKIVNGEVVVVPKERKKK